MSFLIAAYVISLVGFVAYAVYLRGRTARLRDELGDSSGS